MIDLQANLYPSPLACEGRRLEGKVIVVFGASSGIGEAAVLRFAREGAMKKAAALASCGRARAVDVGAKVGTNVHRHRATSSDF